MIWYNEAIPLIESYPHTVQAMIWDDWLNALLQIRERELTNERVVGLLRFFISRYIKWQE